MKRLEELIRRRFEVENQIIAHTYALEEVYGSARKEMRVACESRLEDLMDMWEGEGGGEEDREGGLGGGGGCGRGEMGGR